MLRQLTCDLYEFKMMGQYLTYSLLKQKILTRMSSKGAGTFLLSKFLLIANGENTDKLKEDKKETKTNKGKLSRK